MSPVVSRACLGAALLAVTACDGSMSLRGNAALRDEVAQLKAGLDQLKKESEADREARRQALEAGRSVTFKPTDKGYATLRHDLGVLAVEFASLEPAGNGSRVVLRLGNVAAGAVNDVEAKVEWGKDPSDVRSVRAQKITLGRVLPQGAWSDVALLLEDVPPDQLGFVRISELTISSVSLRQTPGKNRR